jgi:twitching motility protein PilT
MRVIPTDIPVDQIAGDCRRNWLRLPSCATAWCLITGPTGSGKSSTQASIIDIINEKKQYHVVTIEDPIEYLHNHKSSTINQREVGHDTRDFPSALRATLRQAPKVILIGEMRDFRNDRDRAGSGRDGPPRALDAAHDRRFQDRRPNYRSLSEERRAGDQNAVGANLPVYRSQRLIPKADGSGRIAAVEILRSSPRTREYIEVGEVEGKSLLDAMRDGKLDGMQDFDTVIKGLIDERRVARRRLAFATNQNNLLLSLKGMTAAEDFIRRDGDRDSGEHVLRLPVRCWA